MINLFFQINNVIGFSLKCVKLEISEKLFDLMIINNYEWGFIERKHIRSLFFVKTIAEEWRNRTGA